MAGGTGELWSIHRGAAVDRAEVRMASLGMSGQTRWEGALLGLFSLFWQQQAFSQPEQKPAKHRPTISCVLPSLHCSMPQLEVSAQVHSHFHHQHFSLPFLFFQLFMIFPFSVHCSVVPFPAEHRTPSYCLCLAFHLQSYA